MSSYARPAGICLPLEAQLGRQQGSRHFLVMGQFRMGMNAFIGTHQFRKFAINGPSQILRYDGRAEYADESNKDRTVKSQHVRNSGPPGSLPPASGWA